MLDKSSFCGGNSTKATSGINGAGTKTQKTKSIPDTADIFVADTLKGGAKKPELAKVLCVNSAADVDWLVDKFDLDLSLVARLGGHSQPRTHRGKERFPGMTITYVAGTCWDSSSLLCSAPQLETTTQVHLMYVNSCDRTRMLKKFYETCGILGLIRTIASSVSRGLDPDVGEGGGEDQPCQDHYEG